MELSELKALDRVMLTPEDVAEVLGSNPQDIRSQAARDPSMLGFPVCRIGTRTKIPRKPFIRWLGEEV